MNVKFPYFLHLLLKHTFHGSLHIVDGIVYNRVQADFNFFFLSKSAR